MNKTLGQRIAELRKKVGLTQNELADKLMVSNKAVSKWESDNGNPSIEFLPELSKILNCTIDFLLMGADNTQDAKLPLQLNLDNNISEPQDLIQLTHTLIHCEDKRQQKFIFYQLVNNLENTFFDVPCKIYTFDKFGPESKTNMTHSLNFYKNLIQSREKGCKISEENPFIIICINNILDTFRIDNYIVELLKRGKDIGVYIIATTTLKYIGEMDNLFQSEIIYTMDTKKNELAVSKIITKQTPILQTENSTEDKLLINLGFKDKKLYACDIANYLLHTAIFGNNREQTTKYLKDIINQLSLTNNRSDLKLALIDSQENEFKDCLSNNLFMPIPETKNEIKALLKACKNELDNRYETLEAIGLLNGKSISSNSSSQYYPYFMLVINELNDILNDEENISNVQRIMQLGRSVGMIVIVATTNNKIVESSNKVIVNASTKISFKQQSAEISERLLGVAGAESLKDDEFLLKDYEKNLIKLSLKQ